LVSGLLWRTISETKGRRASLFCDNDEMHRVCRVQTSDQMSMTVHFHSHPARTSYPYSRYDLALKTHVFIKRLGLEDKMILGPDPSESNTDKPKSPRNHADTGEGWARLSNLWVTAPADPMGSAIGLVNSTSETCGGPSLLRKELGSSRQEHVPYPTRKLLPRQWHDQFLGPLPEEEVQPTGLAPPAHLLSSPLLSETNKASSLSHAPLMSECPRLKSTSDDLLQAPSTHTQV